MRLYYGKKPKTTCLLPAVRAGTFTFVLLCRMSSFSPTKSYSKWEKIYFSDFKWKNSNFQILSEKWKCDILIFVNSNCPLCGVHRQVGGGGVAGQERGGGLADQQGGSGGDLLHQLGQHRPCLLPGRCLVVMMKQQTNNLFTSFDFLSLNFKFEFISDHICAKPWGSRLEIRGGHCQTRIHMTQTKPRS